MSVAVLCTDCASNTSLPRPMFSPDNDSLSETYGAYKRLSEIRENYRGHTNSFAWPKDESERLLRETYKECSASNWDGEGAAPLKEKAFMDALRFIDTLPITVSMPSDISADPSGYITMEWRKRRGLIFDISFTGNNEIIYAGILGTDKPRGVIYFGDSIPREIINKIQVIGL